MCRNGGRNVSNWSQNVSNWSQDVSSRGPWYAKLGIRMCRTGCRMCWLGARYVKQGAECVGLGASVLNSGQNVSKHVMIRQKHLLHFIPICCDCCAGIPLPHPHRRVGVGVGKGDSCTTIQWLMQESASMVLRHILNGLQMVWIGRRSHVQLSGLRSRDLGCVVCGIFLWRRSRNHRHVCFDGNEYSMQQIYQYLFFSVSHTNTNACSYKHNIVATQYTTFFCKESLSHT